MSAHDPASTQLRAMAAWIAKNGFSPNGCGGWRDCPGCFISAEMAVADCFTANNSHLRGVVGAKSFTARNLRAAGWNETATDDAVAACLIAADLAECEE